MKIPSKKEALFRKYEEALFFSDKHKTKDKLYIFYLLLKPLMGWVKKELINLGLEPYEAESELYLLSSDIFKRFDNTKSSIIPYLQKQLPWAAGNLIKVIKKRQNYTEEPIIYSDELKYKMKEEFYWKVPNVLLEERYVGKCFTRAEKYLIYIIITSDNNNLLLSRLARRCKMDRKCMKERLSDLKEQLKTWRSSK